MKLPLAKSHKTEKYLINQISNNIASDTLKSSFQHSKLISVGPPCMNVLNSAQILSEEDLVICILFTIQILNS